MLVILLIQQNKNKEAPNCYCWKQFKQVGKWTLRK